MQNLLAASLFEVVAGLIFVLFWIISAAVGQVAKKKEEADRRRRLEQMPRDAGSDAAAPPPLPPVLPPAQSDTGVNTLQELERRIREAQARRKQSSGPASPSYRETPPVSADNDNAFEDPLEEKRRRTDEERQRREAAHRHQEKRRQAEEREKKKAEQYRKAEQRRKEQEGLEREAAERDRNEAHTVAPHLRVHRVVSNDPVQLTDRSPTAGQRAPTATAAALRSWLTPQNLRHQYIVTELLAPPLALRPDRD